MEIPGQLALQVRLVSWERRVPLGLLRLFRDRRAQLAQQGLQAQQVLELRAQPGLQVLRAYRVLQAPPDLLVLALRARQVLRA